MTDRRLAGHPPLAVRTGRPAVSRSESPAPPGAVARLLRGVDRDASVDGLPARWARAGLWLPVGGTLVLGLVYAIHRPALYWLLREDHPVEWVQFALCLFAALAAAVAAGRFVRRGRPRLAALLVVVALASVVLAGEEISWGQRVFNLVDPALESINRQGELNLHNLNENGISADKISEVAQLLLGLVACALSLLTRPVGALLRNTVWWWVTPPLFTIPSFLLMSLYRSFALVTNSQASPVIVYQEWAEVCFYLMIAVSAGVWCARAAPARYVTVLNRRRPRRQLDPDSSARVFPLIAAGVFVLVVSVVLAIMTARTGLLPGNVPKP